MAMPANIPALLALALGLFYFATAIGELRGPGQWQRLIDVLDGSRKLRLLGAGLAIAIGAALLLLVPPRTGDWLNLWLFGLGCLALIEGAVLLILPGHMTLFSRAIIRHGSKPVALLTLLLGVAFVLAGLIRL
jgi:hypothetical protein